jgi:hypothetical protein
MGEINEKAVAYRARCKNFKPGVNTKCPNYVKAIKWAKENGYLMSKDMSYNGFIYLEKIFNNELDKIELQVYDGIKNKSAHCLEHSEWGADFGQSIMSETTYYFRTQKGGKSANTLDELFELALKKEKEILENN